MVASPSKSSAGVNVIVPATASNVTEPWLAGTLASEIVIVSPASGSESLPSGEITTAVSKSVDASSSVAIGASFTGFTVTKTSAVAGFWSVSSMLYTIVASPLKSSAGVNTSWLPTMSTVPWFAGTVASVMVRS